MRKLLKRTIVVSVCCIALFFAGFFSRLDVMAGDTTGEESTAQTAATGEDQKAVDEEEQTAATGEDQKAADEEEPEQPLISEDKVLSNDLFSMTMPEDVEGTYKAWIYKNRITIVDKEAADAGFGGIVLTVSARGADDKYNGFYTERKYGELTSGDGTVYDITCRFPTDVEHDPRSGDAGTYSKLRKSADQIMQTVTSTDQGSYSPGVGMKGEELYQDVLQKYVTAIDEKWTAVILEKEEMSPAYDLIVKTAEGDALDRIVYAYYDLTAEGVEELLVGELSDDGQSVLIYDVYGIKDHKPFHALSGWKENSYTVTEHGMYNHFTGRNGEEYFIVYDICSVLEEIYPIGITGGTSNFKIDRSANESQPWFIYDRLDGVWDNVSEEEYNEKFSRINRPVEIDFRPLSELAADRE